MSDKYQKKINASKVKQIEDAGLLYKGDVSTPYHTLETFTSNFLFLKQHDPIFYQLASAAEQFFTVDPIADTLEEKIEAVKRVDRLTESILAKAFRRELVEQEPNDESAEKLLERIKGEREFRFFMG